MRASRPMVAVDAQTFWMSAKIPNDEFLLFAFAGSPVQLEDAIDEMRRRAHECCELRLRVVDDHAWRFPNWVSGPISGEQFDVRPAGEIDWQTCLAQVAGLAGTQLDARQMCWRVHVFPQVSGMPRGPEVGCVVVVQMVHALGDGRRASALAKALFGRQQPVAVPVADRGWLIARAVGASRTHRMMVRDIETGRLPAPNSVARSALSTNQRPVGTRVLRTLVMGRSQLSGPTVTVGVLDAVAEALGGYLSSRGEDISALAAEVPMSSANVNAHNSFRNVGIGLPAGLGRSQRIQRIVEELGDHRSRGAHPAMAASRAAFAAVPAPLLRWGTGRFDPAVRSSTVTGHTVVSSVNRGLADFSFAGHLVLFTAGYPALSPMMSLTHGVHGMGDTIAISVHADSVNIDVEDYFERLQVALHH